MVDWGVLGGVFGGRGMLVGVESVGGIEGGLDLVEDKGCFLSIYQGLL